MIKGSLETEEGSTITFKAYTEKEKVIVKNFKKRCIDKEKPYREIVFCLMEKYGNGECTCLDPKAKRS